MAVSDPMLLTLPPPAKSEFKFRAPHDFVHPPSPRRTLSPKAEREPFHSLPVAPPEKMSTSHRGLPPPSAMSLPDPGRIPPPMAPPPSQFSGMPAPPSQSEESMRNWLVTKAEEEKRKQEEQRTQQEQIRLEQRKIEQTMLQDSFRNGIPPALIPMIFAGIGGGNLANVSLEWLQQYAAQLQLQQQQQLAAQAQAQGSPDVRRERIASQSQQSYGGAPPGAQVLPAAPTLQGQPTAQPHYPPTGMSPPSSRHQSLAGGPTSAPRAPLQNVLPRLTTNEMQIQPVPSASSQAAAQAQSEQQPSSPAIYFHHWVPPTSQGSSGNPPATPSDYANSPKKRKATGAHQPAPLPSSAGQHTSPSFSHISSSASTPGRRTMHGRTRSDASTRGGASASDRPTTSSSQAESGGRLEPDSDSRQRTRPVAQPRSRGGSVREDRSDSGSQSSRGTPIPRFIPPVPARERGSAPVSPRHEPVSTAEERRRSSFAAAGRPP